MRLIAGVDGVGEGPLAGPIVAAAVILPADFDVPVRDSKKLTEKKREKFAPLIEEGAIAYAYGWVDAVKVDEIGKYRAALLAMELAVERLSIEPTEILVDGCIKLPNIPCQTIIGGDDLVKEISAASIIAKVARDGYMRFLHDKSPQYNWGKNKGYGTAEHIQAIARHGLHSQHRRSFAPCKNFAKCA